MRPEPGHYTLAIRAVGYDLDGRASADVTVKTPWKEQFEAFETFEADLLKDVIPYVEAHYAVLTWLIDVIGEDGGSILARYRVRELSAQAMPI